MRRTTSLSGTWQFQIDPGGDLRPDNLVTTQQIAVPMPWQAAFPELARYSGYAWYRRTVDLEEDWLKGDLLLRFGAVDYWCRVFVNGELVGRHEGGYTPFEFSIRSATRPGTNEITVQVYDSVQAGEWTERWPSPDSRQETPGPPFNAQDIPHGKQEWYVTVGGIWQDVQLIVVPATYIDHLQVSTDIHSGHARVQAKLSGSGVGEPDGSIHLSIKSADGAEVGSATVPTASGERTYEATIAVEKPRLWSPDDPYLYTLHATLQVGDSEDEANARFGFREISTDRGQILLNGQPVFLLCALDQDLYPDTIYTVPSDDFLRDQFEKAKQLGLNSLRCHIKPPDPRYLDLADEMGLMVWAEIPSWRTFDIKPFLFPEQVAVGDAIKRRVEQTLEEMVRRDFNHPSLVIWTMVNEDWGTSLPLSSADREWVAHLYEYCKELDPTRLVVDNSACPHSWGPNIHVHSDLEDFHIYANIPDHAANWERSIDQFALRPLWTYSAHGDSIRTGQEPLVLSEFGNWGLPSLRALREHHVSDDPSWFEMGAWWSPWEGLAAWPRGVEERFRALGLDSIWGDYEQFATSTQWHQFEALKFEIETMRCRPSLAGYVITEFTDAYWESNGLLDFARNPKAYHGRFASINSPDVVIPSIDRYAFWDDQSPVVRIFLARYSGAEWAGARLHWSVEGGGSSEEREAPSLKRGEVLQLRMERLRLPRVEQTQTVQVRFVVQGSDGRALAQNSLELLVMPSGLREATYKDPIAVVTIRSQVAEELDQPRPLPLESTSDLEETSLSNDDALDQVKPPATQPSALEQIVSKLGYAVAELIDAEVQLAISTYPTAELLEWVRDGGKLLYISNGIGPFFWAQNRSGAYSGSWITSFSWLRGEAHKRLKAKNPLGLPFKDLMPRSTILGLPYDDPKYQPDYLSGMISGWVHQPSVHTVQFQYGRGRVVMTTFALESALVEDDPAAIAMLHDLIEHLSSDACQPALAANY